MIVSIPKPEALLTLNAEALSVHGLESGSLPGCDRARHSEAQGYRNFRTSV